MRLSPTQTTRILFGSILIMLLTSFSFSNAATSGLGIAGNDFKHAFADCEPAMLGYGKHLSNGNLHHSISVGEECSSDTHLSKECCGTSCITTVGADIQAVLIPFTQSSRRLTKTKEPSFILPFQANSLFRPPRV
jgi:hypothetical protein